VQTSAFLYGEGKFHHWLIFVLLFQSVDRGNQKKRPTRG
jgi:hypothetical protein